MWKIEINIALKWPRPGFHSFIHSLNIGLCCYLTLSVFEFKRVHFRCACSILFFSFFYCLSEMYPDLDFVSVTFLIFSDVIFGSISMDSKAQVISQVHTYTQNIYSFHMHCTYMMLPNLRDMIPVFTPNHTNSDLTR